MPLGSRRFDLDEYTAHNRLAARRAWLKWEGERGSSHRATRRRPRNPEEVAVLTRLAKARFERAASSGEFVRVAERRYRLRVFG